MVNYITMDLNVTGWEVLIWIYLAQNMNKWWVLVNTVMNQRFPQNMTNFFLGS
jgi:hypothetical protein